MPHNIIHPDMRTSVLAKQPDRKFYRHGTHAKPAEIIFFVRNLFYKHRSKHGTDVSVGVFAHETRGASVKSKFNFRR